MSAQETMDPLQFFTVEEAGEKLRVGVQTIRKMIKEGKLSTVSPNGKQKVIPISSLYRWAKSQDVSFDTF
jgi:excisionase family DNA binding protein